MTYGVARFTVAYWCVLLAALLPLACTWLAKWPGFGKAAAAGGFDNRDPRTGRLRRPDRPDVARIATDLVGLMSAIGEKAHAGDVAAAQDALRAYRERATQLVASYPQSN